jgi:predicted ATPase/DNA-binding winged helix-turn-helix (wHTH) protein
VSVNVPDLVPGSANRIISFGPFRLFPARRLLLEAERSVRLGSRALDILIALVERPGEVLSKEELMARVWPNTPVKEGNLKVHVAGLRRVLGDGRGGNRYLVNIPGRGYRFIAPITVADESRSPPPATSIRPHNLPGRLARLIGRTEVVGNLAQQLSMQRLLTIVGPGGIGKTVVALEVAEELIPAYEHGVWLIDLAPIADVRLVPTALASALSLEIRSDSPLPGLITTIRDKHMLIILDNCEHVIEAAATLVAAVLRGSRRVHILATSREPLRVEGERVHRLTALENPPASVRFSAAGALRFSAVQLFVQRATATMNEFELSDADAPSASDLCRKLDGIPLAIEFAAARVDAFGVRGVAALLDDRLRLLTTGHRAALPRHRTISAALEWSYQLLSQEEQTVFRRLAIFVGGFTLEAASAVAANAVETESDIADTVANLVMKSLVVADLGDKEVRFRLLETMRAYALAKLAESGEAEALGRRHAAYHRDLVEAAWNRSAGGDFAAAYAPEIDNIRAALSWALAPGGDASIGVALAAASAPIWLEMSLLTECHGWMGKAIDFLDAADRGTRREMALQTELGLALMFTQGMSSRARVALTRASELAESLQDSDYQLRALTGLTMFRTRLEDHRGALALARRSEEIAQGVTDPVARSTADCILGATLLGLAKYTETLTYVRRALHRDTPAVRRGQILRTGRNHMIQAQCVMAQALWHKGLLDQSAQATRDVLADAQASGHPNSLCFALVWGGGVVFVLLGRGEIQTAERSIAQLKDHAEKHALSSYYACALGFEGLLSLRRGNFSSGERLLRASLEELGQTQYDLLYTPFLSSLAELLAAAGQLGDSLAAIDEALERAERNNALWWMPEALRIKGEVLLLSNTVDKAASEDNFHRSLDLALLQESLSFELRTAMSLGRLYHAQGRIRDARELLSSIYARFTEGFDTADLQTARRHLEEWT